jgi:hypothetical protein
MDLFLKNDRYGIVLKAPPPAVVRSDTVVISECDGKSLSDDIQVASTVPEDSDETTRDLESCMGRK